MSRVDPQEPRLKRNLHFLGHHFHPQMAECIQADQVFGNVRAAGSSGDYVVGDNASALLPASAPSADSGFLVASQKFGVLESHGSCFSGAGFVGGA